MDIGSSGEISICQQNRGKKENKDVLVENGKKTLIIPYYYTVLRISFYQSIQRMETLHIS